MNSNKSYEAYGYPPPSAVPTYPAPPRANRTESWWEQNHKNKPQSNSVGAAALIFVSGGMFMIGPGTTKIDVTKDLELSWFIAGIFGAIIGAIICNRIQKKLITCCASIMVTISGILLVAITHSEDAMFAARCLNGCAVGLIFPLTLVLVGEEAVKSIRGMLASSIDSMCFGLGFFLQMIYASIWPDDSFSVYQMLGVLTITYGIISFFIAFLLQIESPILYLARGQEEMAIDTFRRLQRPFTVTYETYEQLDEAKRYLADNKQMSLTESALAGLPALIKMAFYRVLIAWSLSFYTTFAFAFAAGVSQPNSFWPFYLYGFVRWIGSFVAMFTLDSKGRKPTMIVGFSICCCLTFAVAIIHVGHNYIRDVNVMTAVMYIMVIYQFFAGLASASSSAYLSEAFPLAIKPYYIALAFMAEMGIHIVIIACRAQPVVFNVYELPEWFFSAGGLTLVFIVVAKVALPETKRDTLRECLEKFRKCLN